MPCPRRVFTGCLLATLLLAPASQAFEKRHVFITNRGGNNLVELDDSLQFVKTWFDTEGLVSPNGMAFTPSGSLYVADTNNHRVLGFDKNGVKVVEWPMTPHGAPAVESLNFDKKGVLYASSNPGEGKVPRFDMDGVFQSFLVNAPDFTNLGNVNFTLKGTVILSDFSGQGRGIREIDPASGNVLATFGQEAGLFQEDMFVDGADRIFVSQYTKNELAVFAPDRTLERTFTAPGLDRPTGIVITHDCRVVVASFNSAELYVFAHDGTFIEKHSYPGLSLPESLAIAGQRLPGSFEDSTMEFVPKCDGTDPDGGVEPTDAAVDAAPETGQGGGAGEAGSGSGGVAGSGAGAGAGGVGGAPDAAVQPEAAVDAPPAGAAGALPQGQASGDDGGCGCRLTSSWAGSGWLAALAAALLALRRQKAIKATDRGRREPGVR